MNKIDEIRARCERAQREDYPEQIYGCAAYYCVYDDIPYLLAENERLQGELQDQEYRIMLDAMEQSRDEAIARAEKAEAELSELRTPTPAVSLKIDRPVQIGHVQFGAGCTVWKCPRCGTFLTPIHKYCLECGQAVNFTTLKKVK